MEKVAGVMLITNIPNSWGWVNQHSKGNVVRHLPYSMSEVIFELGSGSKKQTLMQISGGRVLQADGRAHGYKLGRYFWGPVGMWTAVEKDRLGCCLLPHIG